MWRAKPPTQGLSCRQYGLGVGHLLPRGQQVADQRPKARAAHEPVDLGDLEPGGTGCFCGGVSQGQDSRHGQLCGPQPPQASSASSAGDVWGTVGASGPETRAVSSLALGAGLGTRRRPPCPPAAGPGDNPFWLSDEGLVIKVSLVIKVTASLGAFRDVDPNGDPPSRPTTKRETNASATLEAWPGAPGLVKRVIPEWTRRRCLTITGLRSRRRRVPRSGLDDIYVICYGTPHVTDMGRR